MSTNRILAIDSMLLGLSSSIAFVIVSVILVTREALLILSPTALKSFRDGFFV